MNQGGLPKMIAPCGLDCDQCRIFRAASDQELAQQIAAAFGARGITVNPEQVRCSGCLGNDAEHWSSDCEIRGCAVKERNVRVCCECAEFICDRLHTWSQGDPRYQEALARLTVLRGRHA